MPANRIEAVDPNVDMHGNICLGTLFPSLVLFSTTADSFTCASLTDILKEKWSPALSVSTILVSLQSLLGGEHSFLLSFWFSSIPPRPYSFSRIVLTLCIEPNNASPLNVEAAELWDDAEAVRLSLFLSSINSTLLKLSALDLQFKAQLVKHYKPLEDDE